MTLGLLLPDGIDEQKAAVKCLKYDEIRSITKHTFHAGQEGGVSVRSYFETAFCAIIDTCTFQAAHNARNAGGH